MNISLLALICGAVCSCGCAREERVAKNDPVAVEWQRKTDQIIEAISTFDRSEGGPKERYRRNLDILCTKTNEVELIKRSLSALTEIKFDGMSYEQQDWGIDQIKRIFSWVTFAKFNIVADDYLDAQTQLIRWLDRQKTRVDAEVKKEELAQGAWFARDFWLNRLRKSLNTSCWIERIDLELTESTLAVDRPHEFLSESERLHIRERVEAFLGRPIRSRAELKEARKCIPPPSEVVK